MAQYYLGGMYRVGRGVPQNQIEAAKWYRAAAEQGNAKAQYNLGKMYQSGRGVRRDPQTAIHWFCIAVGNGDPRAMNALGIAHAHGEGDVPNDMARAYFWFSLAVRHGIEEAAENRNAMAAELTAEQITQAESRIRAWSPSNPCQVIVS